MAEKRRDHRGIVLEKGESQDSSGRYRYRYYDDKGISHDIYAWRLRPEDETPEGKKHGESLREMETRIQKDMLDNIKAWEANIAVGRLAEEYIEQQKAFWAPKTYNGMTSAYLNHVKKSLGRKKVSKVTPDMIEKHYLEMLRIVGIGTVSAVDKVLNGTFKLAIKRNMIRNNPATGCLGTIKRKCGIEEVEKHALEEEQQKDLLNFIQNDRIYSKSYNLFYLLAWTGCRIGDDDDKIRLNQRKPSKYKGLRRFGPEKNLQRINKFMKERPIFYKNLIQMKENIRFYLRCFYCITKVMILQFNSENRTELARNG